MAYTLAFVVEAHDLRLVTWALVLCAFACWPSLSLASRARVSTGARKPLWLAATGFVYGSGAWATHFISLLAHKEPLLIQYGVESIGLSIAVAIVFSTVGFAAILRGQAILGGAVLGVSIVAMHLIGMTALSGPFPIAWD